MNLLYYYQFIFYAFVINFKGEILANILGKGKDVCGGEDVVIVQPKEGCKHEEGKLKTAPLLEPVGDLCHKKEIIVKPAQCAKSATAKKEEFKSFSFPDFPADVNSALPVPLSTPPANCDPSQLILVLPPPPMYPPGYLPQGRTPEYPQLPPSPPLPNPPSPILPPPPPQAPPAPPIQSQVSSPQNPPLPRCPSCSSQPAPCPSCIAKAQNLQSPPQNPSEIPLSSLPRCPSCSSQPAPCSSCMAKAQNLQHPQNPSELLLSSLPRCPSCSSQPTPCPSCIAKAQNLQSSPQNPSELLLSSLPRCPSCSSQPAPCPSCIAKAQNLHPPPQIPPEISLLSLPRCPSCSGAPAPCSSCAERAKASVPPSPRCPSCAGSPSPCNSCASKAPTLTEYPYYPMTYPDTNFIPADAVSQQLAYKAKQEERIKIEGEIAYGFKTLPIELDQVMPQKDRYPEEALFQFNGQVLEFLPEKLVYSKAIDPYKGSEVLVATKVPTPSKKLSLPEIGFGPVIVEPSPYIKKNY